MIRQTGRLVPTRRPVRAGPAIRSDSVVKALARGADAVAIGRPLMYGLTLGGASGVDSVIRYFHAETVDTVLHCGVDRIDALGSAQVRQI